MKQQIKTIVTDATRVFGKMDPEYTHDKRVNKFLDTLREQDIVFIQQSTISPLFEHVSEQGPALVTTIIYRK